MPPSPGLHARLALLGLVAAVVIWGSNNIVAKILLQEASPLLIALVRFTLAGLLFYLPVFLALHRGQQRFARSDWPLIALLGAAGVAGSLVFHLTGLRTTPATDAAIYTLTTPLFVLVMSWLLYNERLGPSRLLGMAAAALGALLLVTGGSVGFSGGDLWGSFFLLGSSLLWAGYTLFSRGILARRSPLLVLSAASLMAMVAIWPISGLLGVWAELPSVLSWSPTAWLVMAYLVLLMSMLSQWLYMLALRDLRPSQVSALLYTMPLVTAIFAALVLAELPTPTTIVSGLLILCGVWLVNRRVTPRRPAPEPALAAHRSEPEVGAAAARR